MMEFYNTIETPLKTNKYILLENENSYKFMGNYATRINQC